MAISLINKADYQKYKERYCEFYKYAKWHKRLDNSPKWAMAVFVLVAIVAFATHYASLVLIAYVGVVIYFVANLIAIRILKKKAHKNRLNADDLAIYFAFATYENLEDYYSELAKNNIELKSEYRKKATANAKDLILTVKKNWVIGEFKLGEKIFGTALSGFKETLAERLLPNIEQGDEGTFLKNAQDILFNLLPFFRNPSLERLEMLNKMMIDRLGKISAKKESLFATTSSLLSRHSFARHAFWISILTGITGAIFLLGVYIFYRTPWESFTIAAPIWAILLAGYFIFLKKT